MTVNEQINEPQVVKLHNECERPAFILLCEHASNFIPADLNGLGLDDATKVSHAAWDLGALALAKLLTKKLNAPLVAQQVSRLVYDCNRPPSEPSAMPEKSEVYEIRGNVGLSQSARTDRVEKYYKPFNDMSVDVIKKQLSILNQPIIVTIHSFTRSYYDQDRATEIGMLHDEDSRFVDAILKVAAHDADFEFERNKPYGPEDGVTHSLKEYALPHGLHNVMIEVRNDLLADEAAQEIMADKLAKYLLEASEIIKGK